MKYYPTIALALLVWVTVTVARTDSTNPLDFERCFSIGLVIISWFTIGVCAERIHNPRGD